MLLKQSLGQTDVICLVERINRCTLMSKSASRRLHRRCTARQEGDYAMPKALILRDAICRADQDRKGGAGSAGGVSTSITFGRGTELVQCPRL